MKPSKQTATVIRDLLISSRHFEGQRPGKVVRVLKAATDKDPQRVNVNVFVDGTTDGGFLDTLRQSRTGNTINNVPVLDPLTDEERAKFLEAEPFIAEWPVVPGAHVSAPALRAPGKVSE